MPTHPYESLPSHCFWRRSIAAIASADVDPVVSAKFSVSPFDKVATAGSCFAQHIARHLMACGFNYYLAEPPHPSFRELAIARYNYGTFTARYGNIYTTRQMAQLLKRAYGLFSPAEDIWYADQGRCIDPFRPQIQPNGFVCEAEYRADRVQHFAAVRQAVEHLDVLVFTLGLTEAWISRIDGAVFPICPGVAGGSFDEQHHEFINFGTDAVCQDLAETIDFILERNAKARFILTVSPVPLIATNSGRSVLTATTYSKSVLRVAADEIERRYDCVAYFPSYEIITGNHARGRYFADDLRSVTDEGVQHVMRLFMQHYGAQSTMSGAGIAPAANPELQEASQYNDMVRQIAAVICDEEALDPLVASGKMAH
jgi:GSCFA family